MDSNNRKKSAGVSTNGGISKKRSGPRKRGDFAAYEEFTRHLYQLIERSEVDKNWDQEVHSSLNGNAGSELRRLVDQSERRKYGAFFTDSVLATKLLRRIDLQAKKHLIFDPTVGAGDLLLAAARRLPVGATLRATLKQWGQSLAGTDVHQVLVDTTIARLALLAMTRHAKQETLPIDWKDYFPNIFKGDGRAQAELYGKSTILLLNPPFGLTQAPEDCEWAKGRVSEAALISAGALQQVSHGTRVLAILPDVLRAGTFQKLWREHISDLAEIKSIRRHGLFDTSADVDVFLLDAVRRQGNEANSQRWPKLRRPRRCVSDYFTVSVGRVVPHRDEEEGNEHPYIHARSIPVASTTSSFTERRRHKGAAFSPPFVVLRRTSRPGHPYRAAASIIAGDEPVAVENHLIVCQPLDGSKKMCEDLMDKLHAETTNRFLDDHIRCRHLTVQAVRLIPVNLDKEDKKTHE